MYQTVPYCTIGWDNNAPGCQCKILYIVLLLSVNVILIFKIFSTLYYQLRSICTFLTAYMYSSQMYMAFTGLQSKVYKEVILKKAHKEGT